MVHFLNNSSPAFSSVKGVGGGGQREECSFIHQEFIDSQQFLIPVPAPKVLTTMWTATSLKMFQGKQLTSDSCSELLSSKTNG